MSKTARRIITDAIEECLLPHEPPLAADREADKLISELETAGFVIVPKDISQRIYHPDKSVSF